MTFIDRFAPSMPWLKTLFLGNRLGAYVMCAATIAAGLLLVWVLDKTVVVGLKRLTKHTESDFDDFLIEKGEKFLLPVFYGGVAYLGLRSLAMKPVLAKGLQAAVMVLVAVQSVRLLTRILQEVIERQMVHHASSADNADAERKSVRGILVFVRIVAWVLASVLVLDNLGVRVSTFVAGLGIGGIAIALAVQTVLGDLLASLSIAFDKPFRIGDTLGIDDYTGTVEDIGIKSTRLRSVTGEQVVLANADVLKARVRNLGRMPEKRYVIRLRLAYETSPALVERVPVLVEEAVRAAEGTRFVSCLLAQIGDYALEFEAIYFIANLPGRNIGRTNDQVNRGILQRFAAAGVNLAYPTRRNVS